MIVLLVLVASVLCCLMVCRHELPVLSGSVLASGAGETRFVQVLAPLLLLAAIALSCFFPDPIRANLDIIIGNLDPVRLLPASIATAASAALLSLVCRFPAVPGAFVGALLGTAMESGVAPLWNRAAAYLLSLISAPLLCALLAAVLYIILASFIRRSDSHMAYHDAYMLFASCIASLLLIAAAGINNASLFSFLPIHGSDTPILASGLALAAALSGCLITVKHNLQEKWDIADYNLDINPLSSFSLILSMAMVFGFFSSPLPEMIGLAASPLPAGVLFVGGLAGISIARKKAIVDGKTILETSLSNLLSPLLGALLGFSLSRILNGNLANTLILIGLTLVIALIFLYLYWQRRKESRNLALSASEQQAYSTQHSLSALEVKAEMTEKDLLNKLELKRKELVDFAVGISDQKEFMEDVYVSLKEVRKMPDGADKDAATDKILSSIRERMYFTNELNDFYARSEVLHKDFNMRLRKQYPQLTESERKLANLLRQGLSSKNIASLMNITPKSVEISRYRLRTKLGLKRSENLIQYIKSI